jgi:transposase InsO family protein
MRKKVVSPAHRRRLAQEAVRAKLCSGRAACRVLKLSRGTYWYRGRPPTAKEKRLCRRLHELARKHPRYGYRRIAAVLRQEGWRVGKRRIQRLRRIEGLRVPPTRRKVTRRGFSTGLPTRATHRNHVWTWDFIADATVRGGALRMLTILDEHTRECHVLRADRSLRATDVVAWLKRAIQEHGAPEYIRSDNGPEFIARIVQRWLAQNRIKTIYIDPGSPWQNGFVESFHGRFRDECLNREQLWTLTEARVVVEGFRREYNQVRPHSKLGYLSPVRFAAIQPPSLSPVGLRPPCARDGQTPTETTTSTKSPDCHRY